MSSRVLHALFATAVVVLLGLPGVPGGDAWARDRGTPRRQPVDMVVIHSTGGPLCDPVTQRVVWIPGGAIDENMRVINAHPRLGIHYMIGRDGAVRTGVPEGEVAHHVLTHSARSIAIELVNDGDGRDPFPAPQIDAAVQLLRDIVQRHRVARDRVVRHSDVDHSMMPCQPDQRRKVDPGPLYPHQEVLDAVYGLRQSPGTRP